MKHTNRSRNHINQILNVLSFFMYKEYQKQSKVVTYQVDNRSRIHFLINAKQDVQKPTQNAILFQKELIGSTNIHEFAQNQASVFMIYYRLITTQTDKESLLEHGNRNINIDKNGFQFIMVNECKQPKPSTFSPLDYYLFSVHLNDWFI